MPEGPEVKILVNWLNFKISGKILNNLSIFGGRYKKHGPPIGWKKLIMKLPLKVKCVNCKGKFIWWEFFDSDYSLWNTLGMSGWWNTTKNQKHNNLVFKFSGFNLYFNDYRNFGTVKICTLNNLKNKLRILGPDILSNLNNFNEFINRISRKRKNTKIGNALLDQKLLSGIGNYLRADILWKSKISPFRTIENLNNNELKTLYINSVKIANRSYNIQFKKLNDYSDPIIHTNLFYIYYREKDQYGNKVKREKMNNRTIHWVPKIQK